MQWQPKAKAPQRASAYPGDSLLSGMTNAPWRLPPRPSEAGRVIVEYSDQYLPQSHAALLPPPTTLVGAAGVTVATTGRRLHGSVRGWWRELTSRATSHAEGQTTTTAPQRSPPRLLYDEAEEGGWVCIHHPINNNSNTHSGSSSTRPSPSPPRLRRRASLSEEEFETVDGDHLPDGSPRHLQPPLAAPPGAHFRAVVERLARYSAAALNVTGESVLDTCQHVPALLEKVGVRSELISGWGVWMMLLMSQRSHRAAHLAARGAGAHAARANFAGQQRADPPRQPGVATQVRLPVQRAGGHAHGPSAGRPHMRGHGYLACGRPLLSRGGVPGAGGASPAVFVTIDLQGPRDRGHLSHDARRSN
jgi:hypothetical protein